MTSTKNTEKCDCSTRPSVVDPLISVDLFDVPWILENGFMGMGIGAAMTGLRPIVEGMNMGFLLLAFNQISNNCGMLHYTSGGQFKVPMVVRGPGGVGRQLGAEHSQRLESYFQSIPGVQLVACSTVQNSKALLKSAIRSDNPIIFFEHVLLYNLKGETKDGYLQPLERAEIAKEGTDVTILTYSRMRYNVLQAVQELEKKGISAEVQSEFLSLLSICFCRSLIWSVWSHLTWKPLHVASRRHDGH